MKAPITWTRGALIFGALFLFSILALAGTILAVLLV